MRRAAAALLGLAAVGGVAHAADAGPLAVEAAVTSERLSGGRADWRTHELLAHWRGAQGWSAGAALRHTERFGLDDAQVEGDVAWRIAPRWRVEAELAHSGTHRVLPQWRLRSRAWLLDAGGWNLAAGLGRTLYRSAGVQGSSVVELQAERYAGDFRVAWVGSLTRLDAGGSGGAHTWRLDWYRDERLGLGLLLAAGRELENQPGAGVLALRVRSAALTARWRVTPEWALTGELATHRVGDLYERNGLRVGLRRQF